MKSQACMPRVLASPRLVLVGENPQIRALLSDGRCGGEITVASVAQLEDLTPSDWRRADVVMAWHEDGVIGELQGAMQSHGVQLPIMICAENPLTVEIVSLLNAGASDVVRLPIAGEHLAERVRLVHRDWEGRRSQQGRADSARRRLRELSEIEQEVLALVARGLSNKSIARILGTSVPMVELHRRKLLVKLRVGSTTGAVGLFFEASLGLDGNDQLDYTLSLLAHKPDRQLPAYLRLIAN